MKDQYGIRRVASITLIISSALFVILLLLPFWLFREQGDSVGIIGGADGPTAILVTGQIWRQFGSAVPAFLGAVILCSLFCAVFPRSVRENCTWQTSGVSLGLSATFCLGMYCAISVAACLAFGSIKTHPIRIPLGIGIGTVCLILFLILGWLYVRLRRARFSWKGLVLDILLSLLYLPSFLGGCMLLDRMISG